MSPSCPFPVAIQCTISSLKSAAFQIPWTAASGRAVAAATVPTVSATAHASASTTARDASRAAIART